MDVKKQLEELRIKNRQTFPKKLSSLLPYNQPEIKKEKPSVPPFATCFDLETTNLDAGFMGVILCAVIKPWGGEMKVFRADHYDTWEKKRSDDSQIVVDIYNELKPASVWIAHNGVNFDINFLRTRMAVPEVGAEMPQPKTFDPVRSARRYFRMRFNNLESVGMHLGFEGKTRVAPKYWYKAALDGDSKALDYIVEHCIADVILLENVANKMRYLAPKLTQWGSDT